ncbi:MAG TPA: hypothetical protein VFD03_01235 [Clostridia bacterium]|nr:hypothetical protein [Clostridia bacterium]
MISIIQSKKECFCCKTDVGLEDHHIFFGPLRKTSEKWGLKVWLCAKHHKGDYSPHQVKDFDNTLKELAQKIFLIEHTQTEWMDIKKGIGKNYL